MKKIFLALATLSGILFLNFSFASAQYDPTQAACRQNPSSPLCAPTPTDPVDGEDNIFVKVAQILVYITGIASVIMIIIGGFTYVTSQGDPQKTGAAKDTILYAVIGLVIAISAQVLIGFVLKSI